VTTTPPIAVLHLDESCLGNGREGSNPGGGGALVEVRTRAGVQRRDVFLHAPATTNNRMALEGARLALEILAGKDVRLRVLMVSDSEYLVKGMREWVPGWIARGWRRKAGPIENLELWQALVRAAARHEVQWTWVRGHRGHPKNEYANDLAVLAAKEQRSSDGAEPSGFDAWLEKQRDKGNFREYDPDASFAVLERRLADGDRFGLAEEKTPKAAKPAKKERSTR
jgi:ribonuclease HI